MALSLRNVNSINELIERVKNMKFCGPSDDPDEQTIVIYNFRDVIVKLKYQIGKCEDFGLKNALLDLNEDIETIYEVYDLNSRLDPILEDVQDLISNIDFNELKNDNKLVLKPIDKVEILEKIGVKLQQEMKTKDINVFLLGYGLVFHEQEVADSKKTYTKEILSVASDEIIIRIAKDLSIYKEETNIRDLQLNGIDSRYIDEQISKCRNKVEVGDYDGAITNSRTLIESICIYILDDAKISYKKDGNLIKLYKLVSEYLKMSPHLYDSSALKSITSGFFTIINGISSLRNDMGDAHGKSEVVSYRATKRHALLAVNSSHTVSDYLWSSYMASQK